MTILLTYEFASLCRSCGAIRSPKEEDKFFEKFHASYRKISKDQEAILQLRKMLRPRTKDELNLYLYKKSLDRLW